MAWITASTSQLTVSRLPLTTTTSSSTVDIVYLGIILDDQLTMATLISSICRAGFFQLRQLRSVRRSQTTETTRALVQAFISCRLDYCNSLMAGVADVYLQRLRSLQNAAARLVSGNLALLNITSYQAQALQCLYSSGALIWLGHVECDRSVETTS